MSGIISKNAAIAGGAFDKEKQYWLERLSGELSISRFCSPSSGSGANREESIFRFPAGIYRRIHALANGSDFGIFIILVTGIAYLLAKYGGGSDVIVGTPVFKQEDAAGEYLNRYLALRNRLSSDMTFRDLLLQVKDTVMAANEHMNYPLEKIVEALDLGDNRGVPGLLPTMLVFTGVQDSRIIDPNDHEIVFIFEKTAASIHGGVNYDAALYDRQTLSLLHEHLLNYFEAVCQSPGIGLRELDILSAEEKRRLLDEFNAAPVSYPLDKSIVHLFDEQVEKTPDAVAAVYEDREITYRQLQARAGRAAEQLRKQGVRRGDIVGLMLPRSLELAAGYIAILKTGAALIALDVDYPAKRVSVLLKDSHAGFLLRSQAAGHCPGFPGRVIDMPDMTPMDAENAAVVEPLCAPADPAVIVYTSGSTGHPKGVVLHHRGIINHAFTKIGLVGLQSTDICCHNLNIGFVASIWLLAAPLFKGARLVIYPGDLVIDGHELLQRVKRDRVTVLEVVPSLLNAYFHLLDAGREPVDLSGLRWLLLTGEKVEPALVNKFHHIYGPAVALANAYGQSECSDDTLHYHVPANPETTAVPLGKPSHNTRIYILDIFGGLQPVGAAGELYIWGHGLAMGYLNQPHLTAERFVVNPFPGGRRMFRTGDRARWLPGGCVEFLGRVDRQVKIRGHRIEPGEIESRLAAVENIAEAAVAIVPGEEHDRQLCAYIVPASGGDLDIPALRTYLSGLLPSYMVPAYFVRLERLPLNASGKVDRKRLPIPGPGGDVPRVIAPRCDIERTLAQTWTAVLFPGREKERRQPVGIDSDFFQLGGHSLKATILAARIHKVFNVKIPVAEMFKIATIREQAEYIKAAAESAFAPITTVEAREYYPLSSAQKRLYIVHQVEPGNLSYNMYQVFVIEEEIENQRLEEIFHCLLQRHESLRTSFMMAGGEPVQQVHNRVDFSIEYFDAGEGDADSMVQRFIRPFDLEEAPLIRVGLVRAGREKNILAVDMHHIISDAFSNDILVRDFVTLYRGGQLPGLRLQYKDFSVWQHALSRSGEMAKQESYWLDVYSGDIPRLNLPTDYERPDAREFAGDHVTFWVDARLCLQLRKLSHDSGATLYMVLLAIFNLLLARYARHEDIVVGAPVSGRNHADLQHIIGMFVNMLPIRNHPAGHKTFREFLGEVRETTLAAFENQDFQFDQLVSKLGLPGNSGENPLCQAVFNMFTIDDDKEGGGTAPADSSRLNISPYKYERRQTPFNLLLNARELSDTVKLIFTYSTELFKKTTIEKMADHLLEIIQQVTGDLDVPLTDIKISHDLLTTTPTTLRDSNSGFNF